MNIIKLPQKFFGWNFDGSDVPSLSTEAPIVFPYASLPVFKPEAWTVESIRKQFPELVQEHDRTVPYSFKDWCDDKANCYFYALGDRTLLIYRLSSNLNVGAASGYVGSPFDLTKDRMIELAQGDGLKHTGDEIVYEPGTRPVALFLCERTDFHWMRLDRRNEHSSELIWTQKFPGESPHIVLGKDGNPIKNPRDISIPYSRIKKYKFTSFFNVPDDFCISADVVKCQYPRAWKLALLEEERRLLADAFAKGIGLKIPQNG